MKISDAQFDKLLAVHSSQELKSLLAARNMVPSPVQAGKLLAHLRSLDQPTVTLRLGIVHTYTSELLDPWLNYSAALNGLAVETYHAPYGVTVPEATPDSGLAKHKPDITLVLARREDLHPAFNTPMACIPESERASVAQSFEETILSLLGRFRDIVGGQIVLSLLPEANNPGLGLYDSMASQSETAWWSSIKHKLAGKLREGFSGITLLDMDLLLANVGRPNFFDQRLWYSSMFPFAPEGAIAVCDAVTSLGASLQLTRAKVIVLDADNTLWGGVIGEDGMQGIALGTEYPGRAFVDFQRRILALQQRGFILALCSKNNAEDLNEVLETHPHQILKAEHFAAMRVNWTPKPDNLRALAKELNLGLDSFIFVDDSDYECNAVRHSLPEVDVVQVPKKAVEVPYCLDSLARLQITSLTLEDQAKTAMYSQDRQRQSQMQELTSAGSSIDDYLLSLQMKMVIELDDLSHLPRLSQLTQKTNQFNLTTQRYDEQEMTHMIKGENYCVYHFSLSDSFGDSGIVGLAIIEKSGLKARVDTFLMSCRVIGRRAEQAFLSSILNNLLDQGIGELEAQYIPTRKNVLVETFLPDNGFDASSDGKYTINLSSLKRGSGNFPIDIEGPA